MLFLAQCFSRLFASRGATIAVLATCIMSFQQPASGASPILEWSRVIGAEKNDRGVSAAVSDQGQVYMYGATGASRMAVRVDGFVNAYNTNGEFAWFDQLTAHNFFGELGVVYPMSLAVDSAGNAYAVGAALGDVAGPSVGEGGGGCFYCLSDGSKTLAFRRIL